MRNSCNNVCAFSEERKEEKGNLEKKNIVTETPEN